MQFRCFSLCVVIAVGGHHVFAADSQQIRDALEIVNAIGREGANSIEAAKAARSLAEATPESLPTILAGFESSNPLAENLLRSAVETIADQAQESSTALPTKDLIAFVNEPQRHGARARRLAFELLARADPDAAKKLLPNLLTDPSAELRRDAVGHWIGEAEELAKSGKPDEAKAAYEKALSGAVDDDQVTTIVKALKERGVDVDLQRHFGFVTSWHAVGPFDNREQKGFDVAHPPEGQIDLDAAYEGPLGEIRWRPISTESSYGVVDVGKTFDNWKGSATYLVATFDSPKGQPVELRLGTQNAWKLWLNGEYLFGREEYHRGMTMDQYRIPARLKAGENSILIKLLQNEQTEDWAQDYKFQLRVADPSGQAVLPAR
ncbi:MAG: hypothetical protein M3552_04655 [Planctomycetota bacterium]|nr:hypothetical protein [Planctomycetaceae bacterium]MDQ3329930.1 hypothetical protein [Planctomycetota bacterium]